MLNMSPKPLLVSLRVNVPTPSPVSSNQSATSVEGIPIDPFTIVVPGSEFAARGVGDTEVFGKSLGSPPDPSVYVVLARAAPAETTVKHVVASSVRANLPIDFRAV